MIKVLHRLLMGLRLLLRLRIRMLHVAVEDGVRCHVEMLWGGKLRGYIERLYMYGMMR